MTVNLLSSSSIAAATVLGASLLVVAPPASACSILAGPPAPPSYPHFSADGFPTNGIFHTALEWRATDGARLALEPLGPLSSETGLELRTPTSGALPAGARFHPLDDCPSTGPCKHVLAVGAGPDVEPPEQVALSNLRTLLVRDPAGAGAYTCPDVDTLVLQAEVSDDTTPQESLTLLAFIGTDEEDAATKESVDVAFGFDRIGGVPSAPQATVALGVARGRQRDGQGFSVDGPFCFSVAAMDWAGNIGTRSGPRCLDTTDLNDPTVELVDGQACTCAAPGHGTAQNEWGSFAAMVLAALWAGGRRSRRTTAAD